MDMDNDTTFVDGYKCGYKDGFKDGIEHGLDMAQNWEPKPVSAHKPNTHPIMEGTETIPQE
jgi:hypothetical protein